MTPYSTNSSRSRARQHRYSTQLPEIDARNRTDSIERLAAQLASAV